MSQENVEIVRGIYDRPDVRGFFDLLDDEVVLDTSGHPMPGYREPVQGKGDAIRLMRRYWGTWEDYVLEPVEIIDANADQVVAVLDERGRGRGRGSGIPFENRLAVTYTFRKGKIVRWEFFKTRIDALQAAGLSE